MSSLARRDLGGFAGLGLGAIPKGICPILELDPNGDVLRLAVNPSWSARIGPSACRRLLPQADARDGSITSRHSGRRKFTSAHACGEPTRRVAADEEASKLIGAPDDQWKREREQEQIGG